MTGNLLLLPPGWEMDMSRRESDPAMWKLKGPVFISAEGATNPETEYCRVCFNLADGRRLLYTDPRKFGRIELWPRDCEAVAFNGLGPEPLSAQFTAEWLAQVFSGRKGAIKQVILTQEVVAGLGNIYADEALYYASIHPLRRANSLTPAEIQLLYQGIV